MRTMNRVYACARTRERMCGRCASSRDIQGVRHACAYRPGSTQSKAVKPPWYQCSPQKYFPSYNICPQANTLVLISGHHQHIVDYQRGHSCDYSSSLIEERVLQTMQWGLVPSWSTSSSFHTLLNNCRHETVLEKPSFRNSIEKGRRCVVMADGFFEWFRGKSPHQPYFIYFADRASSEEMTEVSLSEASEGGGREGGEKKDEKEIKSEVREGMKKDGSGKSEWTHPTGHMLTMAGLFDVWKNQDTNEPLYTYTVITVEAHPTFAQIHNRMPAILDSQEAIRAWLNPSHSSREACSILHPVDCLNWHPVSSVVNNSRNHTPDCVIPHDTSKVSSGQKNTLLKWFSKSSTSLSSSSEQGSPLTKRAKLTSPR